MLASPPTRNLALLQNLWFTVGADSISARAALRNHAIARRGQDPSLRTDHKRVTTLRGVEDAAPYGLHVSWRLPGAGRCKHRPLQSEGRDIRPRRGQSFFR